MGMVTSGCVCAPPPQVCRRLGYHQKQAQRRGSDDGPGHHRVQGGFSPGPGHQPEHPVLPGPLLHQSHLHPHAHQPAQWVTLGSRRSGSWALSNIGKRPVIADLCRNVRSQQLISSPQLSFSTVAPTPFIRTPSGASPPTVKWEK